MVLGQEKTWELAGRAAVELLTATQDGWQSILKLGDKTLVTRSKPGKTFKTVVRPHNTEVQCDVWNRKQLQCSEWSLLNCPTTPGRPPTRPFLTFVLFRE